MSEKKKTLKLAILNDIHEKLDHVEMLQKYWKENNLQVDCIVCCGDICTVHRNERDNEEINAQKMEIAKQAIAMLEELCPKVLYVPGNHDPTILFEKRAYYPNEFNSSLPPASTSPLPCDAYKLSDSSVNLHRNAYHLKENLVFVGVGGSVPQFDGENYSKKGFPYSCDEEFAHFLHEVLPKDGKAEAVGEHDNIIIVTHNGPSCSHTSLKFSKTKSVKQTGSHCLTHIIENKEYKNRFSCILHGHTHDSQGLVNHETVKIVNAGAVKFVY